MLNDLTGYGVIVTRPAHQAESLCQHLTALGAESIRFPTLTIEPARNPEQATAALTRLAEFDLAIFISANAVEWGVTRLSGKLPPVLKLATIGKASARALRSAGYQSDLVPTTGFDSEALLALPELRRVTGQRILIFRGEGGRETLAETLRARGARVEYAEVYRRSRPPSDPAPLLEAWRQNRIHAATATSNETLLNLYQMIGETGRPFLLTTQLIVVSSRAAQLAVDLEFEKPALVAPEASDNALIDTLLKWVDVRRESSRFSCCQYS